MYLPKFIYLKRREKSMYHIKIANETFSCHMQDSLLAAAKKNMMNIPYGCANGGCGMCKMKVVAGVYKLGTCSVDVLNETERTQGYVLACKTYPLSNLELKPLEN